MKDSLIYYSTGPLLYCPANRQTIADSIINEKTGTGFSLALCLEDTIGDNFVKEAERMLLNSIHTIYAALQTRSFYLPKIFIRVRNPQQIGQLTKSFGESLEIITGFIIPKFSMDNAASYIQALIKANEFSGKKLYMMPIYEDPSILNLKKRFDILYGLKDMLSRIEELVLNIRVGGNDLCHMFGFRRHSDESIHQIKPVSAVFSDIITVYGMDYIVSGPVWEYYSGPGWKEGLIREIKDDRLCGFTGKTVIHPRQISVVNSSYQISRADFDDAQSILNWDQNAESFVSGNLTRERMNEYKTHRSWARQTIFMAEAFGIKD